MRTQEPLSIAVFLVLGRFLRCQQSQNNHNHSVAKPKAVFRRPLGIFIVPCSPSPLPSLSSTRVRLRLALRCVASRLVSCLVSCLVPSIYSYTTATDENMKTPTTKMWKMSNQ
jgi:hypothetical protein